ncbi:MAG: [FeFe] hydrogenase H-cluster radical SAM maturase HydE [Deltaproteobacteria bacterium]|nr:[FeFe] hydrogenase H-cluster radical SAM maturase HydE [Deltaproteobacteria bacterium]
MLLNEHLTRNELLGLLGSGRSSEDSQNLYDAAYHIKLQHVGAKVYFRGLIKFSNICEKNCLYCGIRKDNPGQQRYMMNKKEILDAALWAYDKGYGSIVLQSGERTDPEYIGFVAGVIESISKHTAGRLGITLSLGEQDRRTYERWREAGAHRYLLRIETSNPELYAKLHPADHSFTRRVACLQNLKDLGYQLGTGIMIGLPFQTLEHLIDDILFFERMDIDMIGMGPYVIHEETPLAGVAAGFDKERNFELTLGMIALCRIMLRDVNIAATTALQAVHPQGREMGLRAGANIIMPIITPKKYREHYQLYNDKPCVNEQADQCKGCLEERIRSIKEKIAYNAWGDPPHYFRRTKAAAQSQPQKTTGAA